jgi:hypothetical protein
MKTVKISVIRKSQTFSQSDLEAAFTWLSEQMTAADLADCETVSVQRKLGLTEVNFSLITTPDRLPPAPFPEPVEVVEAEPDSPPAE